LGIASSPAVLGDLSVVGSKEGYLYALDIPTGQLRWKTRASDVITSPPVFGERVVCIQSGGTTAFDIATGNQVWRAGLGAAIQAVPVLAGDVIYVASLNGEVYALE